MSYNKVNKQDGSLKRVAGGGGKEYNELLTKVDQLTSGDSTQPGSVEYKITQIIGNLGDKSDGTPYGSVKEYTDDKISKELDDLMTKESDDGSINTIKEMIEYIQRISGGASSAGSITYQIIQAVGELGNKEDGQPYANAKEYTDIKIAKALDEFVQNVTDDDTVNTFKELVDYVAAHAPETAQMAADILANQQAIAAINADSGSNSTAAKIETAIGELGNKEDGTPYANAKEYMDDKIASAIDDFATTESNDNTINTFREIVAYIATLTGDDTTAGSLTYILNQRIGDLGTKEDGSEYENLREYIDEKVAAAAGSGSDSDITFTVEDYNGGRVLVAHHTYDDGT